MVILKDGEKAFGKAHYPFIIKALKKLGIEWVLFQCNKYYIWQTYIQHYTNWGEMKSPSSKISNLVKVSIFIHPVPEDLTTAKREEKEMKDKTSKGEVKSSLFHLCP